MAPPTVTTPNQGLVLPTTGNPDFETGNAVGLFAAALTKLDAAKSNVQKLTAAGAIAITDGLAVLNSGAASAITLALPVAGLPSAGGNDGQELDIVALDAFAYTVTTPSNGLNGTLHIATWAAAVGNNLRLRAYNGSWYTVSTPKGVTIS